MARRTLRERGYPWAPQWLLVLLVTTSMVVVTPSESAAGAGCCYCYACEPQAPSCTDLTDTASCATICQQNGCNSLAVGPGGTCAQGCAGNPPYLSPTPTATPTATISPSPTISQTPSTSPTALNTPVPPTPEYCCQGVGYCQTESKNTPICDQTPQAGETPIMNAVCNGGLNVCQFHTATPTRTSTKTFSQTPTTTNTLTPTPTINMGNVFNCDRVKASQRSAEDGKEKVIQLPDGTRKKVIMKAKYWCGAGAIVTPGATGTPGIERPEIYYTCYKTKDVEKITPGNVYARNGFEIGKRTPTGTPVPNVTPEDYQIDYMIDVIKGELLCVPSYKVTPTPKPTATTKR